MNIYKLTKGELIEVDRDTFPLEKDIQSLVERNLENLFGLEFVSTEFKIGDYRIDTLAFDRDTLISLLCYRVGLSSYLSITRNPVKH